MLPSPARHTTRSLAPVPLPDEATFEPLRRANAALFRDGRYVALGVQGVRIPLGLRRGWSLGNGHETNLRPCGVARLR